MTRQQFVDAADTFCGLTGGSQTSGKRTVQHNKDVGGVPNSAHLYGLGMDVTYDAHVALEEATERARRLGLKLIREGDHDHLQPLDWQAG